MGKPGRIAITTVIALLALGMLAGCGQETPTVTVDFSKRIPIDRQGRPPPGNDTLRVAVAAIFSPQESRRYYHDLLRYIGSRTQRTITVERRRTYEEINTLLGEGRIDLAFICSGPYATGRVRWGFRPLAAPVVMGKDTYRSYLIVRRDSPIEGLDQLRGKTVAFTDPDSNTGCLLPSYLLHRRGETRDSFFAKTIYTHSHDNSIMAVGRALVDGAFVHEQIWEYFERKNPVHTAETRVVFRSEPFGNPPIVASPALSGDLAHRIQQLLLDMHKAPEGRQILDHLMVARFVPVREGLYDPIRRMAASLKKEAAHGPAEKP